MKEPGFNDPRLTPPPGTGQAFQVRASVVALRASPEPDGEQVTQALAGESAFVFAEQEGFGAVQLEQDRYTGWADMAGLAAPVLEMTHKVRALRTYAYSQPHLKSAPHGLLSMGAMLRVEDRAPPFVRCARAGWVFEAHLAGLDQYEDDPAAVAARFEGAPYLWGGCESLGLDCTGLTRAAFAACGVRLPRDSDMQFAWCGDAVTDWQQPGVLRRGDLVFWKGHVGILEDADTLIHANASHMAVAREPLDMAIARIMPLFGEPLGVRRIDFASMRGQPPDWLSYSASEQD